MEISDLVNKLSVGSGPQDPAKLQLKTAMAELTQILKKDRIGGHGVPFTAKETVDVSLIYAERHSTLALMDMEDRRSIQVCIKISGPFFPKMVLQDIFAFATTFEFETSDVIFNQEKQGFIQLIGWFNQVDSYTYGVGKYTPPETKPDIPSREEAARWGRDKVIQVEKPKNLVGSFPQASLVETPKDVATLKRRFSRKAVRRGK